MARIISVLQQVKFLRALGWVMLPACLEVLGVLFFGTIFSPSFGQHIMAAMSGMRNAPEIEIIDATVGNVLLGALILLPFLLVLMISQRLRKSTKPFPPATKAPVPIHTLLTLAAAWVAVAILPQIEQYHFVTHAALVQNGNYRESLDYLARHTRKDFPTSRRIEPNPYRYPAWEQLPPIMAALRPTDPEWIRRLCLDDLGVLFSHYRIDFSDGQLVQIFTTIEQLPEGKAWVKQHESDLSCLSNLFSFRNSFRTPDPAAEKQLTEILHRLGLDLKPPDPAAQ
jgi:hypothetical protein